MLNKALALAVRSFRVDARSKMSHLLRFGLAAVVMLCLFWVQESRAISAPGLKLFSWMIYSNAFLVSLIVPLYFASAITEEKEERTLALLKVANVGAATIVLGKALPRLFTLMFVVMVQFPFTLLAITLGGVTFAQVAAAYLAILAYALAVACMSLMCSVMMRLTSNAVGLSGLLLLGYHVFPYILYGICSGLRFNGASSNLAQAGITISESLWKTNAFMTVGTSLQSGFSDSIFNIQVTSNLIAAFVFLVLSVLTFEFFNTNIDAVPTKQKKKKNSVRSNSRRAWSAAIVWKDFVYGSGGWAYVIGKFVIYGMLILLITCVMSEWGARSLRFKEIGAIIGGMMIYAFIPLEITMFVSRLFNPEIRQHTLSGLMLLPKSTRQICWAKIGGGLLGLIPVISYSILGVIMAPGIVLWIFEGLADKPSAVLLVLLTVVAHALLFWHMIAALSLSMNGWWAISLAFLMHYFGMIIVFTVFSMLFVAIGVRGSDTWMLLGYLGAFSVLALTTILHFWIGKQLQLKAAAD